jgi:uncharacterized protein
MAMNPVKFSVFLIVLHLHLPCSVIPASFDCAKAKTVQEKLMCANAVLSKLDDSLSQLYSLYREKSPNPEEAKQQQIGWMKNERNMCTTAVSLEAVLRQRAAAFKKSIAEIGPESEVVRWKWVVKDGENLYPQLLNPTNDRKLDAINVRIVSYYKLGNTYDDRGPCEEEFDHTVVMMASRGIFSLERSIITCGSPMASIYQHSYDVKTGAEIGMPSLFKNWETDRERILNLIFRETDNERVKRGDTSCLIVPTLLNYYKHNENGDGDIEMVRVIFLSDSVSFMPDFPRGLAGCAETVTLPCRNLVQFAVPNSVLLRFK